ncbi:protocadherin 18-like [Littorina saxatilis]|uniref:protocadherin 18-like n=1 Tax=Littorina saxatilis TaxID=31220 RepID=UPI0038B4E2CB
MYSLVLLAVICSSVHISYQQSNVPVLTIPAGKAVITLNEKPTKPQELARGITCTGDGAVRVFLRSVAPSSPCGACFAVGPDNGVHTLYFNPSQGSLNYTQVTSYFAEVECTDDVSSVSASIEVRLLPNSPPVFTTPATSFQTTSVLNADKRKVGSVIYQAAATDPDGDAVFYKMETLPDIGLFEIGDTDGKIRTRGDLRYLGATSAQFNIYTFDAYNDPVGPRTVQADFAFQYAFGELKITNTQKVVYVKEDPDDRDPSFSAIYELEAIPHKAEKYNWKLWAVPEEGLDYYTLNIKNGGVKIQSRTRLDYEYEPLRSVTLIVEASDGFCDFDTYNFTVEITDVNEPPTISSSEVERTVYEGSISFHPNVTVTDPDLDENLTWTLLSPSVEFHVDATTGIIYSTGEFNVGRNTEIKFLTLELAVEDKERERAKLTIKLAILDKNDNAPHFTQPLFERAATACSPVGRDLPPRLNAIDFDSSFQGNNKLIFSGRGNKLAVTATGHVVLTKQCTAGERETFSVYVEDQGTYPGTLQGIPSTVTLFCRECPPTTTTTPYTTP